MKYLLPVDDLSDRLSWIPTETYFLGRCVLFLESAYIGFVLHGYMQD